MAVARIKLLRNKREVVIRQMRRDIAMLLESGQDATARIRAEHVIREQNIMAANELIELFCELIVSRLAIIAKRRECPADLKEGISSVIFAGPRCSEIPELLSIRDVFEKKYGKDSISAATDLRPNAGVNRLLVEKLSVKTPSGEVKLKVLKQIAKEYQVQWDTAESEAELLKPPEEHIEGPNNFAGATSLPLKPVQKRSPVPNNASSRGQSNITSFEDIASAAGEAAEKALAAAEAAALLARAGKRMSDTDEGANEAAFSAVFRCSTGKNMPNYQGVYSTIDQYDDQRIRNTNDHEYYHCSDALHKHQDYDGRKMSMGQSYNCQKAPSDIKFDDLDCEEEIEMEDPSKIDRRHSHNIPTTQSYVRYDDDYAKDHPRSTNLPPERAAPPAPVQHVHPKLPDYDTLAACFKALKHLKAQHM